MSAVSVRWAFLKNVFLVFGCQCHKGTHLCVRGSSCEMVRSQPKDHYMLRSSQALTVVTKQISTAPSVVIFIFVHHCIKKALKKKKKFLRPDITKLTYILQRFCFVVVVVVVFAV